MQSFSGKCYFIMFIDNYTHFAVVFPIKEKSEVPEKFKEFFKSLPSTLQVWMLHSDNGSEYTGKVFLNYLCKHGIKHSPSLPYTPEYNGVTKHYNYTIMEMTHAMLLSANVTSAFWAEALTVAVYINNHSSTKANNSRTPFELWTGNKLCLSHLHPFSCPVYLLKLPHQRSKLMSKSNKGLYLGPAGDTLHHCIWVKASHTVTTSCDVSFVKPAVPQLHLGPNTPPDITLPAQPVQVNQSLDETHPLGLDDTFSGAGTTSVQYSPSLPVLPHTTDPVPLSPLYLGRTAPAMNTLDSSPSVSPISSP